MSRNIQTPFDVSVVVQTLLRPSLGRAVRSVFRQDLKGRIQVLVGIDKHGGDRKGLEELIQECPDHICLTVIDLGYSTSQRHGGLYPTRYGGGLRTILSYAANSKYVAYLDDDDWWAHDHLSSLISSVTGKVWAFSYRWMVDQETGWPICRDEWDFVGPHRGINKERFGGFVAPSNLLLDKQACHFILPFWSLAAFSDNTGEDRLIFDALLKNHPWAATGKFSCYYELRREDQKHLHHAREFTARDLGWIKDRQQIDTIMQLSDEAAISLENGKPEATIEICLRVLSLNPYHATSLYNLAMAEWRLGREQAALTHITLAREVDDQNPTIAKAWAQISATD